MQQFFSLLSWRLFTAKHVSAFSHPSSGAQWLQWQPLVLPSYRDDSRAVFVVGAGRPARPQKQHECHHDTKVKPEAATAVIELLVMGGKTPETCWAVNKRQDNKLENCCIWLVIYLNCSSLSIAIGIMQSGVKTDCVYHFILRYFCPFLLYEASYRIAPNTATTIYHNTNVTDKDLIPFNP